MMTGDSAIDGCDLSILRENQQANLLIIICIFVYACELAPLFLPHSVLRRGWKFVTVWVGGGTLYDSTAARFSPSPVKIFVRAKEQIVIFATVLLLARRRSAENNGME